MKTSKSTRLYCCHCLHCEQRSKHGIAIEKKESFCKPMYDFIPNKFANFCRVYVYNKGKINQEDI